MSEYRLIPYIYELAIMCGLFVMSATRVTALHELAMNRLEEIYRSLYRKLNTRQDDERMPVANHYSALALGVIGIVIPVYFVLYGVYHLHPYLHILVSIFILTILFDTEGDNGATELERISARFLGVIAPLVYLFFLSNFTALLVIMLMHATCVIAPDRSRTLRTALILIPAAICFVGPLIRRKIGWDEVTTAFTHAFAPEEKSNDHLLPPRIYELFTRGSVFSSSFLGTLANAYGFFMLGRIALFLLGYNLGYAF